MSSNDTDPPPFRVEALDDHGAMLTVCGVESRHPEDPVEAATFAIAVAAVLPAILWHLAGRRSSNLDAGRIVFGSQAIALVAVGLLVTPVGLFAAIAPAMALVLWVRGTPAPRAAGWLAIGALGTAMALSIA